MIGTGLVIRSEAGGVRNEVGQRPNDCVIWMPWPNFKCIMVFTKAIYQKGNKAI